MEPIFNFVPTETPLASGEMVKPPSWSWMAYTGGIRYGTLRDDRVSWMTNLDFEFTNHRCILNAPLRRILLNCYIILNGNTDCCIRDDKEAIIGWIRFDYAKKGSLEYRVYIQVAEGTAS
jgi:hypothetical protein